MITMSHMLPTLFTLQLQRSQIKCEPRNKQTNKQKTNTTNTVTQSPLCTHILCATTIHFVDSTKVDALLVFHYQHFEWDQFHLLNRIESQIITEILHFNEFPLN